MARVKVKLYGKLTLDSKLSAVIVDAGTVKEIFPEINRRLDQSAGAKEVSFKDALVFVNGKRTANRYKKLHDNDLVWLMSPTVGG